ncbi:hypothetical protein Poli38472_013805 [Pythium oligandrum]|uniref:Uncharacterized protein n=1 Tax=Pythium oligandrum TaxID=41045 RepID=A0A8K1C293_PYTOL|nr:hypothetical protein Poli38472_013805 [Pythium oligandrum]|eukprot:TMW55043.1 hypothetical protein Poli38472_013805 [Pythium oligandrum]
MEMATRCLTNSRALSHRGAAQTTSPRGLRLACSSSPPEYPLSSSQATRPAQLLAIERRPEPAASTASEIRLTMAGGKRKLRVKRASDAGASSGGLGSASTLYARKRLNVAEPRGKKTVRWATITIHEFGVGHGGSAVPKNGPSIGLSDEPEFTWSTRVGEMAHEYDGVRRFTSSERVALLQQAGFPMDRITTFVEEASQVRKSRELYYSSEMKSLRKKRKAALKAARRANKAQQEEDSLGAQDAGKETLQPVTRIQAPSPQAGRSPAECARMGSELSLQQLSSCCS